MRTATDRATDRATPQRAAAAALLAAGLLAACASVPAPGGSAGPALPGAAPAPGSTAPSAPALGFFSRINVPGGHRPALRLTARGVQVFRCEARRNDSQWVFRVPEADLTNDSGKVVARHGADFSFEHSDGSRLIGKVAAFDEAPSRDDLRWLLLTTTSHGQGSFAGVRFVQRVHTRGGMPPASCGARERNQLLRVPFSAEFVFYKPG